MSAPATSPSTYVASEATLFGHPTGLFALFFAEMWERFSYYGMRALLVLYMQKGFLSFSDTSSYRVYGAYTALVYMTPFFGGMIADRLLGARRAVVLGGLLMAAGHLTMTIESEWPFYIALALLIVGNGFFKPNISTIVGTLYPPGSPARDGGFTIFYMGINLGAAMAPLLCGYIGETYGWHYGFGLATVGMLVGLAVFVIPTLLARGIILLGALVTAVAMVALQDTVLLTVVNGFVAVALVVSGLIAFTALGRGGLPDLAGAPPAPERLRERIAGMSTEWLVYTLALVVVPVGATLVWSNRMVTLIPDSVLQMYTGSPLMDLVGTVLREISTPTGLLLFVTGVGALGYITWSAMQGTRKEGQRLFVAVVLMMFSLLFWAFFEQAGSSINNFTDRNVDRVFEAKQITQAEVGSTVSLRMSQEQLGYRNGEALITLDVLDGARKEEKLIVDWVVDAEDVGMGYFPPTNEATGEIPASTYQSANPIFILLFGLVFSSLWTELGRRKLEPSTPVKFGLGLLQLGLGFVVLWYGATQATDRGMVGMSFLIFAYLLHTTGELCLSPVGLSMVTKLSPGRLVSTMMGAWFLATAFSQLLSSVIAVFTGVGEGGEEGAVPPPVDTVNVYGDVFFTIGVAATVSAVVVFAIAPLLTRWMHTEDDAAQA